MSRIDILKRIDALTAEQARIWTPTGCTMHADNSIEIHGVTPSTIRRVARINSELWGLRMRLHRMETT